MRRSERSSDALEPWLSRYLNILHPHQQHFPLSHSTTVHCYTTDLGAGWPRHGWGAAR